MPNIARLMTTSTIHRNRGGGGGFGDAASREVMAFVALEAFVEIAARRAGFDTGPEGHFHRMGMQGLAGPAGAGRAPIHSRGIAGQAMPGTVWIIEDAR